MIVMPPGTRIRRPGKHLIQMPLHPASRSESKELAVQLKTLFSETPELGEHCRGKAKMQVRVGLALAIMMALALGHVQEGRPGTDAFPG